MDIPIRALVLISFELEDVPNIGLYGKFYLFVWPIFIETVIFGFLVSALLERYNPAQTSRRLAKNRRNHTVVIGYQHLGIRIVDYLRDKHRPYVLIHDVQTEVDDLLDEGEPVIIGTCDDDQILKIANIKKAKELFILVNDIRQSIIYSEKAREINPQCKIYIRLYEHDISDYLKSEPIHAKVFSTSKWALESIQQWSEGKKGGAIVIGRDHLAEEAILHLEKQDRKLWIMDPDIDEDLIHKLDHVSVLKNSVDRMESFTNYIDLSEISQIFFCWKDNKEASTAVYLSQRIKKNFPGIELYVRVFDEELSNILNKIGVITFSTTQFGLKRLQTIVDDKSGLK
jgi:hypothetical protein